MIIQKKSVIALYTSILISTSELTKTYIVYLDLENFLEMCFDLFADFKGPRSGYDEAERLLRRILTSRSNKINKILVLNLSA